MYEKIIQLHGNNLLEYHS